MTSTSLGLTRVLAVLGMVASSLALDPVLYTHLTHRDHSTLLPWLSELQIILLGCPTVISFSLLGTYLLLQGQFLFSLLSFSTPTFLVLVAMSIWLTVLAAYWALAAKPSHEYSKATAKARLAQLDGYKVETKGHGGHSRKPRKRNSDGHGHHGGGGGHGHHPANNVHLYPTLPLA